MTPLKIYDHPIQQRSLVSKDNNGKIGVYARVNKLNGKIYVGSKDLLYLTVSDYHPK